MTDEERGAERAAEALEGMGSGWSHPAIVVRGVFRALFEHATKRYPSRFKIDQVCQAAREMINRTIGLTARIESLPTTRDAYDLEVLLVNQSNNHCRLVGISINAYALTGGFWDPEYIQLQWERFHEGPPFGHL